MRIGGSEGRGRLRDLPAFKGTLTYSLDGVQLRLMKEMPGVMMSMQFQVLNIFVRLGS